MDYGSRQDRASRLVKTFKTLPETTKLTVYGVGAGGKHGPQVLTPSEAVTHIQTMSETGRKLVAFAGVLGFDPK